MTGRAREAQPGNLATVGSLLHSFAAPLGAAGLDVRWEPTPRSSRTNVEALSGAYIAECRLSASLPVSLNVIAMKHAAAPQAFIREFIEASLRPFAQRLDRAANAAVTSWSAAIAESSR